MNYVLLIIIIILLLLINLFITNYEKFNDWAVDTDFPEGPEDSYSAATDPAKEQKRNYLASNSDQWTQNDAKNEKNYQMQKARKNEIDNIKENKLKSVDTEQSKLNQQLSAENKLLDSQRIHQKNKLIRNYITVHDDKIRIEKRKLGAFNTDITNNTYKNNVNYSISNNILENTLMPTVSSERDWKDMFTKVSSGRYYLRTFSEKEPGDSFYQENKLNDENTVCNVDIFKK